MEGAQYDGDRNCTSGHCHFRSTSGGGIAYGENEIPGWPQSMYGSIGRVIELGTKMMFDEGPENGDGQVHGHYENMVSLDYTKVGCGIYVTSDGDVWIVQDFR